MAKQHFLSKIVVLSLAGDAAVFLPISNRAVAHADATTQKCHKNNVAR